MNDPLSNPQRRRLKALAQRLEPVLRIGKHGLSETFLQSTGEALDRHELIKIRFEEFKDHRHELAADLARRTDSHLVWIVGHVAVLFRRQPDPARRKVHLPD